MRTRIYVTFLLSVLIILSAFYMPVYGSTGEIEEQLNPSMIVNASWLDDEMLRIDVVDAVTGTVSSLAVRLSDFVTDADVGSSPYIMIQAVDLDGNLSGIIQISNPFYVPTDPTADTGDESQDEAPLDQSDYNANDANGFNDETAESPQLGLTPDGTGTVVDNIVTQNDLEFFTVFTEAGNVFYLVVDRQRNTDNVYLLNAVTEADLMALAEESDNIADNTTVSGIPAPPTTEPPITETQPPTPEPEPEPEVSSSNNSGNSSLIIIAVIVVAVGGAAYYFKIVKGKGASSEPDDDYWDDEDEDVEDDYMDDINDSDTIEGRDDE